MNQPELESFNLAAPLPCIVCSKQLQPVFPVSEPETPTEYSSQPYKGLMFYSPGNYGSTVFDPISKQEDLHVVICDDCIINASLQYKVALLVPTTPVKPKAHYYYWNDQHDEQTPT